MPEARTLFLNGTIAEESWFDDDVTPQLFKDELMADSGDITVWINSPGGDKTRIKELQKLMAFTTKGVMLTTFEEYISGKALKVAAENVGLKIYHGSAGRMLRNTRYLGDDYYPAIIDQELFDRAEEERQSRANQLGRVRELQGKEMPAVPLHFTMRRQTKVFYDPYEQAEYAYSLIESEMNANGTS